MTAGGRRLCAALAVGALWWSGGCERAEPADDVRVITVWDHQGRELENAAMRRIVEAFNAAHQQERLRIEIDFFPDRQYADKVSIASAWGHLPDVPAIDGPYVGPGADAPFTCL